VVLAAVLFLVIAFCRVVSVTRRRFFGPSKSCVSLLAVSVMGCDAIGCDKDRFPDDLGFVMVRLVVCCVDFGKFLCRTTFFPHFFDLHNLKVLVNYSPGFEQQHN
jgi:hypothetical protein